MIQEVKERIEQLRHGNVPEGYISQKGITIPETWKQDRLGRISKVVDGTHQTPTYVESGVPFVSVENIHDIYNTNKYITVKAFEEFKVKPTIGDILMTRITAGIIGETAVVTKDDSLAYYVSLSLIRPTERILTSYLNQYINGLYFRTELYKRTIHTAFPKKINLDDIGKCLVVFPPLEEQQKIAAILTTQDKVIELKEKLLAEKQQQRKYLMQQLLTAKNACRGLTASGKE